MRRYHRLKSLPVKISALFRRWLYLLAATARLKPYCGFTYTTSNEGIILLAVVTTDDRLVKVFYGTEEFAKDALYAHKRARELTKKGLM